MKYDNYIIRTKDYVGIFKFKSTLIFWNKRGLNWDISFLHVGSNAKRFL